MENSGNHNHFLLAVFVKMADEKEKQARREVMSRRVLSFKLWRDSVDTSVFDEDDLKKLREAEETLQSKFEELDIEPSVSTKLSEEEAKALSAVESVYQKKLGRKPPRQPSLTEQPIQIPPKRKLKKAKGKEKSPDPPPRNKGKSKEETSIDDKDKDEGGEDREKLEAKRLKKKLEEEEDSDAFPSVTLRNLGKGHVAEVAKVFGSSSTGKSSKASSTKSGIKKLL